MSSSAVHYTEVNEVDTEVAVLCSQTAKRCFICKHRFRPETHFSLFCTSCKKHSERYRFAEWLTHL